MEVIEDEHKIDKLGLSYKNITGTTIGRIDKDNIGFRVNGFSLAVDFDNMAKGFPELKEFYHLEVVKHYVIKEFLTRNTEHYLNPYLYILHDVPNSDVLYHTYLPYIKEEMWKLSREGHTFATDWLNDLELV
ncbi:hypothetical protein [Mangrovibacillus cuniculi]|uniref:Uncharacterized protein n=1 Tax=Mangrovibacillus cuniculi TaxID=2593652 RepID=A0A7S8CCP1_9BACI|nr:hypothetical protein [Mangrovibacillus cuniculi]QPC47550.1 hypothetical protein G8O30_11610 [Mangrovibacillus cuniculi]